MTYALENRGEGERLEEQAGLAAYRLDREMDGLIFGGSERVLDAGCGTGLVSRYLLQQWPSLQVEGCDASDLRLEQARDLTRKRGLPEVRYFKAQIEQLPVAAGAYDALICRYVLEHVADPLKAAKEFHRVLRKGGKARIIDLDGVVYNLGHRNEELRGLIEQVRAGWPSDLEVGRRLPAILTEAGFTAVEWHSEVMSFQGAALEMEMSMVRQRFAFGRPVLCRVLGSERQADRFIELYCELAALPENVLFYNKFVVDAVK